MRKPARKRYGPTPTFDELYDCAEQLGTCEVVIERSLGRPGRLTAKIRRFEDGFVVHEADVETTIEDAALAIRRRLETEYGARS